MLRGFLDHLEDAPGFFHRQAWTKRFFCLNEAFHCLEYFTDESMQRRVGRIELTHAQIATADELGELLFHSASPTKMSSKISIENSRRFVFRIACFDDHANTNTKPIYHYLCAELPVTDTLGADNASVAVNATASRQYRDDWLRTLRATALKATTPTLVSVAPLDARELQSKVGEYMDQLHLSVHVTDRKEDPATGKGTYTLTVQAWTLQRELVDAAWQVLEYACAWEVPKTSVQLRDFDAQLRQIVGANALRDLTLPSFTGVRAYLKHKDEAETERRITLYNSYWDTLLRLSSFSMFGTSEGAMLDGFLEISPHLSAFKRLEAANGQNLKLRSRKVVPWSERERFEEVYRLHMEMVRAQEETKQKLVMNQNQKRSEHHSRHGSRHDGEKHGHHRHRQRLRHGSEIKAVQIQLAPTEPVPVPIQEETPNGDSVHERIARIGHKLLVEAFQSSTIELHKSGDTHRPSLTL